MPIYEYSCERCGIFEEWHGINAPALERCPQCGGPVERLISLCHAHWKGHPGGLTNKSYKGREKKPQ